MEIFKKAKKKRPSYKKWKKSEEEFIRNNINILDIEKLALALGRTERAVKMRSTNLPPITKAEPSRSQFFAGVGTVETGKHALLTSFIPNFTFGQLRHVNPFFLRALALTPFVRMCIDTIIEEMAGLEWDIVPKKTYEDNFDESVKHRIKDFFEYPNRQETFDNLLRALLWDLLSGDDGVIVKTFSSSSFEVKNIQVKKNIFKVGKLDLKSDIHESMKVKVPNFESKWEVTGHKEIKKGNKIEKQEVLGPRLIEMYARDGATFTINADRFGLLPDDKPAYFQFPFSSTGHSMSRPIPFFRREIVYFKRNNRSGFVYGQSKIESMVNVIELLTNSTRYNRQMFENSAIPDLMVALEGNSPEEVKRFQSEWDKRFKGKAHKSLFINSAVDVKTLNMTNRDMEWLDGIKFYRKLIMALYHVTQTELGFTDESNKHSSQEQSRIFIRKQIKPMMKLLQDKFTNEIVTEFYDGPTECEFKFFFEDTFEKEQQRLIEEKDLDQGVLTINEVRIARGLEPVEHGDTPLKTQIKPQFGFEPQKSLLKSVAVIQTSHGQLADWFVKYFDSVEVSVKNIIKEELGELRKIHTRKKGFTKSFNSFWAQLINFFNLNSINASLKAIVKKDLVRGINGAERDLNLDFGFGTQENQLLETLTNEQINGYVLPNGKRFPGIKGINDKLEIEIRQAVLEGLDNAESIPQITKRVEEVFEDVNRSSAMRIARTESLRINNTGRLNTFMKAGVKKKKFLAKIDSRTSNICKRLNGQVQNVTATFKDEVTGEEWMTPPVRPNCRSTFIGAD